MIEKVLKRVVEIIADRSQTNAFDDNWIFKVQDTDRPCLLEYKILTFTYKYLPGSKMASGWEASIFDPSIRDGKAIQVTSENGWSRCPLEAFRYCLRARITEANRTIESLCQVKKRISDHMWFLKAVKNNAAIYGYLPEPLVGDLLKMTQFIEDASK